MYNGQRVTVINETVIYVMVQANHDISFILPEYMYENWKINPDLDRVLKIKTELCQPKK